MEYQTRKYKKNIAYIDNNWNSIFDKLLNKKCKYKSAQNKKCADNKIGISA